MKYRSYNEEIKKTTAQILDVVSDITIDRRDGKGNIQQLISVPCVYGNRSRILKSLENGDKTLKVPMACLSLKSISRDSSRANDLNSEMMVQRREWDFDPAWTKPVPINIIYEFSIISAYQEDLDQIMSNLIPFLNPDIYVVVDHPKQPDQKLKTQIVWDSNISVDYPSELDATTTYRCTATTSFTARTWVFPGLGKDYKDGPLIHKINFCPRLFQVGDVGYMLDRWYDVPHSMSFDSFRQNIICGLIKPDPEYTGTSADINVRDNYDWLRISGGYDINGTFIGVSGYWQEVSGVFDYAPSGSHVNYVTGDICYLLTQEGYMLLYAATAPWIVMTPGMAAVDYLSICTTGDVSGELSGGCLP